ncbi:MAG: Uma2 family endonuclease [Deltaproteobacteria bacterium]|nr:MAG: Uma2 family endonuclease [Deltaproteobacteria bacterium]
MARGAPAQARYTKDQYFELVKKGVLRPDDRVELLEGVVVAMAPHSPGHASAIRKVSHALGRVFGDSGVISVQLPLVAGRYSVPEPDVAVLPGGNEDYQEAHPTEALLVVEVADSSLAQDRITKAALYARAGVPEYWIVNLRDDCVEVYRRLDRRARCYGETRVVRRGGRLEPEALPGGTIGADDLLPSRKPRSG